MKSLQLLSDKKFSPFFWTQFLGAFNDNFFKNALVILITFKAAEQLGVPASILVTLSAGIFILPFFLFSATAGQIADRAEKSNLIQKIKLFEIFVMLLGVLGFLFDQVYFLLFVLFLTGFQSAIFGPVKYSLIPQLVGENKLIAANALVGMGTFLAILLGTILGGVAVAQPVYGEYLVSFGIVLFAFLGWFSSIKIHKIPALTKIEKVEWNFVSETIKALKYIKNSARVFTAAIGISWFWFVGSSFLVLLPSFGKEYLGGNEYVVNLFLACFSVGIGVGSLLCEKLSKGEVTHKLIPLSVFCMSTFAVCIYFLSSKEPVELTSLLGIVEFSSNPKNFLILCFMVLFAVSGGVYIVPLYAIVQKTANSEYLSRVIAGINVLNSLFMVMSSVLIIFLLKLLFTIPMIFIVLAVLNLFIGSLVFLYLKRRA